MGGSTLSSKAVFSLPETRYALYDVPSGSGVRESKRRRLQSTAPSKNTLSFILRLFVLSSSFFSVCFSFFHIQNSGYLQCFWILLIKRATRSIRIAPAPSPERRCNLLITDLDRLFLIDCAERISCRIFIRSFS